MVLRHGGKMRRTTLLGFAMPDSFKVENKEKRIVKKFDFELLTPIFGGDAKSWELNLKEPVRASAVKGQLRTWWRTMQNEADNTTLLYKENKIWGGDISENEKIASQVEIAVLNQRVGGTTKIKPAINHNTNKATGIDAENPLSKYVLFPVEKNIRDGQNIALVTSLNFTLQVSFHEELEMDVMNTLRLWTLFGGVGARTRRGCGSIFCKELMEPFHDTKSITQFFRKFATGNSNTRYTYYNLNEAQLFANRTAEISSIAGKKLLDNFGFFRQKTGVGRGTGQQNRPGRSFFPEPDAIRTIMKQNDPNHKPEHPDGIWFPRIAFGMPLPIEFKNSDGDPQGRYVVQPKGEHLERLPSPAILKVIKLPDNTVYQIMLVFKITMPDSILKRDKEIKRELSVLESNINAQNKKVKYKANQPDLSLQGRTIYKTLADHLNMKEVTNV